MKIARAAKELTHRNTLVLRKIKLFFQRYPGKDGTDAERGIADAEWILRLDGRVLSKGRTSASGEVELYLPAEGDPKLEIFGTEYALTQRHHLEAHTDATGQERRLSMLGYELGTPDGTADERSDRAILNFQADQGLDPTGVIDNTTRDRIRSQHGS